MSEGPPDRVIDLRALVRRARLLTIAVAIGGAAYLGSRFDFVTLPVDGCSPVARFSPGSRLLVDRWAGSWSAGDRVFVSDASGVVHLGVLGASEASGSWHVTGDMPDCPGLFPASEDPIREESILGRVVLSLGR